MAGSLSPYSQARSFCENNPPGSGSRLSEDMTAGDLSLGRQESRGQSQNGRIEMYLARPQGACTSIVETGF
jgi:hypothetical protein